MVGVTVDFPSPILSTTFFSSNCQAQIKTLLEGFILAQSFNHSNYVRVLDAEWSVTG